MTGGFSGDLYVYSTGQGIRALPLPRGYPVLSSGTRFALRAGRPPDGRSRRRIYRGKAFNDLHRRLFETIRLLNGYIKYLRERKAEEP